MLNAPPPPMPTAIPNRIGPDERYAHMDTDYLGSKDHNWFEIWDVGVRLNNSTTPGLGAGQKLVINTDHKPEYWLVTITGDPDASGLLYLGGDAAGPPLRLGNSGSAKLPARGGSYLTLVNAGTGLIFGTIIAVAGFTQFDLAFSGVTGPRQSGTTTTFTVVSVPTGGGSVLAANPLRKSAFFQNLGANQITLGKGVAPPANGSGIILSGTGNPGFNDTSSTDQWWAIAATAATNMLVMEVS